MKLIIIEFEACKLKLIIMLELHVLIKKYPKYIQVKIIKLKKKPTKYNLYS